MWILTKQQVKDWLVEDETGKGTKLDVLQRSK